MLEVLNDMRTKYNLLKDEESLKRQLYDITSYMEFITSLSNILKKEEGYEFFISDKRNFIRNLIHDNIEFVTLDTIKEREKHVSSVMYCLDNYSEEDLERQKNIYIQTKIDELEQPLFMKNDDLSSVIKTNYVNLRNLKRIEREGNERTIKSLENDKTFLYLVNCLIKEYPKSLDKEKVKLIKNIINNSSRENFDSVKEYLCYEIYKVTTLNNINKLRKEKIKRKSL